MREDTDPQDLPDDLRETADRLRNGRPSWTPEQLDGIKLRAMKREAQPRSALGWALGWIAKGWLAPQLAIAVALVALITVIVGGAVKSNVGQLALADCTQYNDCGDTIVITQVSGLPSNNANLGPMTVQLTGSSPTAAVLFTLTTSSPTGGFSTSQNGTLSSSITVTIPAGSSKTSNTFYYGDPTSGTPTITATPSSSQTQPTGVSNPGPSGTQVETITPVIKAVSIDNKTGGTLGKPEAGDTIVFTYSGDLKMTSICSASTLGNTSSGSITPTNSTTVTLTKSSGKTPITFASTDCTLNLGSISAGDLYVGTSSGSTLTFAGSSVIWNGSNTITVTLGSTIGGSGSAQTVTGSVSNTFTPSTSVTDPSGHAVSGTTFSWTGTNF